MGWVHMREREEGLDRFLGEKKRQGTSLCPATCGPRARVSDTQHRRPRDILYIIHLKGFI